MNFIRLENTYDAAMSFNGSPQETPETSRHGIVQLLTTEGPYIQRTYTDGGFENETFVVRVKEVCGDRVQNITAFFDVLLTFQDPETGYNQIYWQLNDIPYDFGESLVYLEIERNGESLNNMAYSSPFYLSKQADSEFTARVDYRNSPDEIMQSTQLRMFYRQPASNLSISSYDTVSGGQRVTQNSKLLKAEWWWTNLAPYYELEKVIELFTNKFLYIDGFRTTLFEVPEIPEAELDENFSEIKLRLVRDYNDPFNPNTTPVNPIPKSILLTSMTGVTDLQFYGAITNVVTYTFTINGFIPTQLRFQRSLNPDADQWTSFNTLVINSPFQLGVPEWPYTDYYYRVFAVAEGIASNALQIARIYLDSVHWGINDKPSYYYSYSGFIPTELIFQYSQDGVNWTNLPSNDVVSYTEPGVVPNFETIDYKYRIWHQPTNTYSNIRRYRFFEMQINSIEANGTQVKVISEQHGYPDSGFDVLYQYSMDGIDWRNSEERQKYAQEVTVTVPLEYKLFKIYEPIQDVSSNVVELKR